MDSRARVLISADELVGLIRAGDPITVLDVRWRLDEPDGRAAYLQGHVPGAVYVSLEDELSDHTIPGRGRHPLPSGRSLQAAARRWGIRQDSLVVVYDDWNRAGSARAWWVLTAAGLADVRILDGGLSAWRSSGASLETGAVAVQPGNVTVLHDDLYAGSRPTLTAEQTGTVTLLDARAPERFRGDVEPVDPVAGHIPGAKACPARVFWPTTALFSKRAVRLLSDVSTITAPAWARIAARVSARPSPSRRSPRWAARRRFFPVHGRSGVRILNVPLNAANAQPC